MRLTLQLNAIDNMSKVVSSAANRSMRSLNTMAQTAQQRANRARNNMFESGVMAAGGVAALAYPVKMAANYEMLRIRMVALTQSQAEGMRLYRQTIKLASETPLTLEQVAQATTRLIGFGRTAKDAIVDVKMLGDVVTLAGGDINAAMVAYGQAAGEGRVMTRDLTQFVNAGVPIFKMLGEVTGANGAELKKMAEQGQLSFALLEEAFKKSTSSGGQFADGMKKMSASASGGWVRMTDELGRFADVFGSSVLPMLKSWNEALIPIISGTSEWFRNHQFLAQAVMVSIGIFTAFASIGLILNGIIWVGSTALAGYAAVAGWAGWQTLFASNAMWTLRIIMWGVQMASVSALKGLWAMGTGIFTTVIPAIWGAITSTGFWISALGALELALFPLLAIGAGVALLVGAFIAVGVAIRNMDVITEFLSNLWDSFTGFLGRAYDWGANLISSIVDGIKNAAPSLFAALDGAMTFARGFFPSSPAKRGAFRDINRIQIIEQVAKNIKPNSLAPAMQKATDGGVGAIGPTAAAQMVGGSGGTTSITYNPNITIGAGTSAEDRGSFAAMLEQHKNEMARMVQDVMRQDKRKQFSVA